MKPFFKKLIIGLAWLAVIGVGVYIFRAQLLNLKNRLYQQLLPCEQPITYSLGTFDKRFGISQKAFIASVADAAQIWEKPVSLNLFEYAPSGTLKINLIYDYRQSATQKLAQLGIIVKNDQATYDKLRTQYQTAQKSFLALKTSFEGQVEEFNRRNAAYAREVDSWNKRGGAPQSVADALHAEEAALKQLANNLKAEQTVINNKIDEINALADTLNRLAQTLNLSAQHYNTVGASQGSEFEEGSYTRSAAGEKIDIYQFDNSRKLMRVLAHELGHALGLGHNTSTKAIMYYLNNGVNAKLVPADLAQLKQRCNIK